MHDEWVTWERKSLGINPVDKRQKNSLLLGILVNASTNIAKVSPDWTGASALGQGYRALGRPVEPKLQSGTGAIQLPL